MSLTTNKPVKRLLPDGVTRQFGFDFKILSSDELFVYLYAAGETVPVTIPSSSYTVAGVGEDSGGSIRLTDDYLLASGYPPSGSRLVLWRKTVKGFDSDYISGNPFPASNVQADLERIMMAVQEVDERVDRVPMVQDPDADPTLAELVAELEAFSDQAQAAATSASGYVSTCQTAASDVVTAKNAAQAAQAAAEAAVGTILTPHQYVFTTTEGQTTADITAESYSYPTDMNKVRLDIGGVWQTDVTRTSSKIITFPAVPGGLVGIVYIGG